VLAWDSAISQGQQLFLLSLVTVFPRVKGEAGGGHSGSLPLTQHIYKSKMSPYVRVPARNYPIRTLEHSSRFTRPSEVRRHELSCDLER